MGTERAAGFLAALSVLSLFSGKQPENGRLVTSSFPVRGPYTYNGSTTWPSAEVKQVEKPY